MIFDIKWHPKALRNFNRLPPNFQARIVRKIDFLKEDPFRFLSQLRGQKVYKLRIGDYRALIDVDFENNFLLIKIFDHRSKIYKRL